MIMSLITCIITYTIIQLFCFSNLLPFEFVFVVAERCRFSSSSLAASSDGHAVETVGVWLNWPAIDEGLFT